MSEYILARGNGRHIPQEDKIFGISNRAKKMAAEKGADKVINATIGSLLDDNGEHKLDDNGQYILSIHIITSTGDSSSGDTLKEAISDTNVPAPPEEDESETTENNDMESEGITNEEAGLD